MSICRGKGTDAVGFIFLFLSCVQIAYADGPVPSLPWSPSGGMWTCTEDDVRKLDVLHYPSGAIKAVGPKCGDMKVGVWTYYFNKWGPDRKQLRKEEGRYLMGVRHGSWSVWHENGERRQVCYVKGEQNLCSVSRPNRAELEVSH